MKRLELKLSSGLMPCYHVSWIEFQNKLQNAQSSREKLETNNIFHSYMQTPTGFLTCDNTDKCTFAITKKT